MNRRESLIRLFLQIPVLSGVLVKLIRGGARRTILLNVFSVAGFQFHEGPEIVDRLRKGMELKLTAEATNPHDSFAVAIYGGNRKIGYVPRSDNHHISRMLRQEVPLLCRITEVDPEAPPWNQVAVEVLLVVEE